MGIKKIPGWIYQPGINFLYTYYLPVKWNRLLIEELYPYLTPCLPVPPEITPDVITHNTKRINIQLSLFIHNFYL